MKAYTDYIVEKTLALLNIPSPSGYPKEAAEYVKSSFAELGFEAYITRKGGVLVDFGGEDATDALLLEAHCDTLGAMVAQIKNNGRLKLTPLGGLNANNTEAENVTVITRSGKRYEGCFQLNNASVHVNPDYSSTQRSFGVMEVVLDENTVNSQQTRALGIEVGDIVAFEPRSRVSAEGYIKSRFLDDKLSVGILLGLGKYIKEKGLIPARRIYGHITVFEEVGHGGSASVPEGISEAISVDMGCVGEGLNCSERQCSICCKDSGGPYHYDTVNRLVAAAKQEGADYALDIYPFYSSDVEASLRAGHDIRHGLIGPGVYASHGYERSHKAGVESTLKVLVGFIFPKA